MLTGIGLYRAKVTRITTEGVYVEVPNLSIGLEFGPCETYAPWPIKSTGTYSDPVPGELLQVGDRVLVGQVEDVKEDIVVICKLQ